jgi:hypothetical protein
MPNPLNNSHFKLSLTNRQPDTAFSVVSDTARLNANGNNSTGSNRALKDTACASVKPLAVCPSGTRGILYPPRSTVSNRNLVRRVQSTANVPTPSILGNRLHSRNGRSVAKSQTKNRS